MTKKLLLLMIIFISLLSVILIAVWGTLPENQNLPKVSAISFEDYSYNEEDEKIINVYDVPYHVTTEIINVLVLLMSPFS